MLKRVALNAVSLTNGIRKNMETTGNIWGHSIDYVYKFKFQLWGWDISVEQRRKGNFMGRFGGEWQFKLGIMGSSWRSFIISYWVGSIRFYRAVK